MPTSEGRELVFCCPGQSLYWSLNVSDTRSCRSGSSIFLQYVLANQTEVKITGIESAHLKKKNPKFGKWKAFHSNTHKKPYKSTKHWKCIKMDSSLSIMFVWFDYKGNCCVCGSLFLSSRPLCTLSPTPRHTVFPSLASSWLMSAITQHRKSLWGTSHFPEGK